HQVFNAVDDGVVVDTDGAIFGDRLHDERELDVVRMIEPAAIRGGEERRTDTVEGEHLFGDGLVLRQEVAVRPGARVGQADEVEVGGNVHLLGVVAGVGLGEVEYQVSAAFVERVQRGRPPIQ